MKVLFTDLDGTLLNNNSEVSEYTKEILDIFTEQGNVLVLSSGRPLDSILEVKEKARLNYKGMYIVAYNGCLIYDCDNDKIVYELRVPMELVDTIQDEAKKRKIHIQTYTFGEVVSAKEDDEIKFYRRKVRLPLIVSERLSQALKEPPFKMLSIDLNNHAYHAEFEKHLNDNYGDYIKTLFSNDYYLEIFNKSGGKGEAIGYFLDTFNLERTDTYAAGDADNDKSMIIAAGTGIAMKNGSSKVKEVADVVTEYTNDEDGLAKYIVNNILN